VFKERGVEDGALDRHLDVCEGCAKRYELLRLEKRLLRARPEIIAPGEDFFAALRSRIARDGFPPLRLAGKAEEPWSSMVWATARTLIPAMTMLLALIIGATVLWGDPPSPAASDVISPRDRLIFNEVYDYQPTTEDVIESLVAIEERQNGR
jgi:hypothetical protein